MAHSRVTGAIGEQHATHPQAARGADGLGDDRRDPPVAHFHLIDALLEHQGDARFGADNFQFVLIIVNRTGFGIATFRRLGAHQQFLHDVPHVWIRRLVGVAFGPDAHFGTRIATKHRPVLDQCDFKTIACGGNGGAGSRHASPHHNQVEISTVLGFFRQTERRAPELCQLPAIMGRLEIRATAENDRIAPAGKSCQVMQRNPVFTCGNLYRAAIMPMPLGVPGPEHLVDRLAIYQQLESPRRTRRIPRRHPIPGAHPNPVAARLGENHLRHRVLHRNPEPVRNHIRRTHHIHRLLVDVPTAGIIKRLGFEQHDPRGLRRANRRCRSRKTDGR